MDVWPSIPYLTLCPAVCMVRKVRAGSHSHQLHLPQHFGARGRGGCVAQLTGAFAAATAAVLCLSRTAGSGGGWQLLDK